MSGDHADALTAPVATGGRAARTAGEELAEEPHRHGPGDAPDERGGGDPEASATWPNVCQLMVAVW